MAGVHVTSASGSAVFSCVSLTDLPIAKTSPLRTSITPDPKRADRRRQRGNGGGHQGGKFRIRVWSDAKSADTGRCRVALDGLHQCDPLMPDGRIMGGAVPDPCIEQQDRRRKNGGSGRREARWGGRRVAGREAGSGWRRATGGRRRAAGGTGGRRREAGGRRREATGGTRRTAGGGGGRRAVEGGSGRAGQAGGSRRVAGVAQWPLPKKFRDAISSQSCVMLYPKVA
ncbi:hypothetical protein GGX14DRAFT_396687 [Mycena pura]|uniref:Uncharacterized protein n=1 Tax=Mycena pura TaxID=153505 RepID=A0AAD6V9E8_9AGAR|nr:hypothetical protein GGX14DRAFT_396687 [Mycena pura]